MTPFPRQWLRQGGFGMITAIVILVILAALAAAITSLGTAQQTTSVQDIMATKARQAAKAGNEWGLYMAIKDQNWGVAGTKCSSANQSRTLDLTMDTGFTVQVCCALSSYAEGQDAGSPPTVHTTRLYTLTAVACNAATCGVPATALAPACGVVASGVSPNYVERIRVVMAEQ